MKQLIIAAATAAVLGLGMAPAEAAHTHYDESARKVANEIGCKNFKAHEGGAAYYKAGVCYLKGKRVNVVTFNNSDQQLIWNNLCKYEYGPNFWWANGKGAIVVAKNGNKPAARIGANRLPGKLVHG